MSYATPIANLSTAAIQNLSTTQIDSFSAADLLALSITQMAYLNSACLNYLFETDWQVFSTIQNIGSAGSWTTAQWQAISTADIANLEPIAIQ